MYLHEYQAKKLLLGYGVPVPDFSVVSSLSELDEAIAIKALKNAVLKIQVHAGGRGKAGGVLVAKSPQEIKECAKLLLGKHIVTAQTGPDGVIAEKLLVDTPVEIAKELYLAVVLDRKTAGVVVIVSSVGGVEIEELAKSSPEKIVYETVPETKQLHHFQLIHLTKALGLSGKSKEEAVSIIQGCVDAFFSLDALLIEINPLVITKAGDKSGELLALDAKIQIDDNALFRQPELASMWDPSQVSKAEQDAKAHDLAYVALDGTIGCIVNGAGLAMATMDLIRYWKGEPANFLDVGGGASLEKVVEGFKILFKDPKVKAVLVNIFGGIMNCEIIAQSLLQAVNELKVHIPVVVRMEGTNVASAKKMLQASDLTVYSADTLDDAAKRVVEMAHGNTCK
jgi:succinyl-CoA synthetase beta subunit